MVAHIFQYCNAPLISKHSRENRQLTPFLKVMSEQATTAETRSHALAGTDMSGADTVVQVLADEGVDTIFGYSGGAILPIYDAVFRYN